ncbi:baseplate J/gp47 family protein [Kitasatospora sp. NPDC052896]|uniref:baseplate J/gp47 family protein n=1 Tax=Kitasatospora sp. NPDC052896 TaxID=3364061 RepID=UPI0037C68C79
MADDNAVTQIDYTSRDYVGYRTSLLNYATQVLPTWTSRSPADFGVLMVEIFSYLGDIVSFYQDRIQDESFLATATLPSSVMAIAQQLGYVPYTAQPAQGSVAFSPTSSLTAPTVLPAGTQVITAFQQNLDAPVFYETQDDITVPAYTTPVPTVAVTVVEGRTQGSRPVTLYPPTPTSAAVTVNVEDLGVSSGAQSQDFTLAKTPALLDTVRVILDDGTGGTEWTVATDFLLALPTDQIFTVYTDNAGTSHVTFGDGINGAIPATGMKVTASYRIGGGTYGNMPAGSIVDLAAAVPGIQIAAPGGSSDMTGGADAESLDQIRANAPRAFRTQGRAVNLQDYADLALNVQGVADAMAVGVSNAAVSVYVIGPNYTPLSEFQRDQVAAYVQPLSLAGAVVSVFNGTLVPINIGGQTTPIQLGVLQRYRRQNVVLAVTQNVQNAFAPGIVGFGSRVSLSQIYEIIQSTPGVDWVQINIMARYDLPQSGTADILCRDWEIPVFGNIYIAASGGV